MSRLCRVPLKTLLNLSVLLFLLLQMVGPTSGRTDHFTEGKTEAQRASAVLQATQLPSGRAGTGPQVHWGLSVRGGGVASPHRQLALSQPGEILSLGDFKTAAVTAANHRAH